MRTDWIHLVKKQTSPQEGSHKIIKLIKRQKVKIRSQKTIQKAKSENQKSKENSKYIKGKSEVKSQKTI